MAKAKRTKAAKHSSRLFHRSGAGRRGAPGTTSAKKFRARRKGAAKTASKKPRISRKPSRKPARRAGQRPLPKRAKPSSLIRKTAVPAGRRTGAQKTATQRPSKAGPLRGLVPAPSGPGTLVGSVVHYYTHIGVAVIELTGPLKAGDRIAIRGATTDFQQLASSMQIDRIRVAEAKPGDAIGLKVIDRVREKDLVFRV